MKSSRLSAADLDSAPVHPRISRGLTRRTPPANGGSPSRFIEALEPRSYWSAAGWAPPTFEPPAEIATASIHRELTRGSAGDAPHAKPALDETTVQTRGSRAHFPRWDASVEAGAVAATDRGVEKLFPHDTDLFQPIPSAAGAGGDAVWFGNPSTDSGVAGAVVVAVGEVRPNGPTVVVASIEAPECDVLLVALPADQTAGVPAGPGKSGTFVLLGWNPPGRSDWLSGSTATPAADPSVGTANGASSTPAANPAPGTVFLPQAFQPGRGSDVAAGDASPMGLSSTGNAGTSAAVANAVTAPPPAGMPPSTVGPAATARPAASGVRVTAAAAPKASLAGSDRTPAPDGRSAVTGGAAGNRSSDRPAGGPLTEGWTASRATAADADGSPSNAAVRGDVAAALVGSAAARSLAAATTVVYPAVVSLATGPGDGALAAAALGLGAAARFGPGQAWNMVESFRPATLLGLAPWTVPAQVGREWAWEATAVVSFAAAFAGYCYCKAAAESRRQAELAAAAIASAGEDRRRSAGGRRFVRSRVIA
ncbi:MAG: hypothetical protein JWO31_348 [Phycisphaerales bacterium]|nr:hypothetical protein [Phycisphaerales bacterium]